MLFRAGALARRFRERVEVAFRYFGLWAPPHRAELAVVREILDHHPAADKAPTGRSDPEPYDRGSGPVIAWVCRACGCVSSKPPREIPRDRAPPP